MYIASQSASKWPDLSNHVPELYKERVEFIRTAAINLQAMNPSWGATAAWDTAKQLWDARPEDC